MFLVILLNIKVYSIKHNFIIKIRIHNQQWLGDLYIKKEIRNLENGKKIIYIDKRIK